MEKSTKRDMILSKIGLKNIVNMNNLAGVEFNSIIDNDWKLQWKANEDNCVNKVEWLKIKQVKKLQLNENKSDDKIPLFGLASKIKDVKYKDKDIIIEEMDNKPTNPWL